MRGYEILDLDLALVLDFRIWIHLDLTLATRDEGPEGKLARHEIRRDEGMKGETVRNGGRDTANYPWLRYVAVLLSIYQSIN